MADESISGDSKIIKVTVKTPRDKKELELDGSLTIKEVALFSVLLL